MLLLDEPAAGIDFKDQKKFYDLISRINRETGVTVLLVSHDLNMVQAHADHVLCLKDGAIQCQGPPQRNPHADEPVARRSGPRCTCSRTTTTATMSR